MNPASNWLLLRLAVTMLEGWSRPTFAVCCTPGCHVKDSWKGQRTLIDNGITVVRDGIDHGSVCQLSMITILVWLSNLQQQHQLRDQHQFFFFFFLMTRFK